MVVEGFRAFTCNTRTGKMSGDIPVTSADFGVRVNAGGTITFKIPATSVEASRLDIKAATTPKRRSLGVSFQGRILECGPIWARRYDQQAKILEVTAGGLWTLFDRRKALKPEVLRTGVNVTGSKLEFRNLTKGSIARELVRTVTVNHPYGGGLNLVLPPLQAGKESRTYYGYELKWVGDALRDLTEEAGGPDIRFQPRFMGSDLTRVEWVMEIGDPYLTQSGPNWQWDGTRPNTDVIGFGAEEDATTMTDKSWRPGEGSERDMLLGAWLDTTLTDLGWPYTETEKSAKSESNLSVLTDLAQQDIEDGAGPTQTFNISVKASGITKLGQYSPGDIADVTIPSGHPLLNPGKQTVRIMGIDGNGSDAVTVSLQSLIGTVEGTDQGAGTIIIDPGAIIPASYPDDNLYPGFNTYPTKEATS